MSPSSGAKGARRTVPGVCRRMTRVTPQAMLVAVICAVALFVDVALASQLWAQRT